MIGKIVLTEKGVRLSNELFIMNPDDPPPFVEEGKPIQKPVSTPKLANLYEKSNGFLDRLTLKSAQSNRQTNTNRPFFLPNYEYQEVFDASQPQKHSKYPGIYPPKTAQGGHREKMTQQMQQLTSSNSLKQGIGSQKDSQQLTGLLMTGSHPLILDYDTLSKQQQQESLLQNGKNRKATHLQSVFLRPSQQQQEEPGFAPFDTIQGANKRTLPGIQTGKSNQLIGTHNLIGHSEESPKKDALLKFSYGISSKIDEMFKGSITSNNKYVLTGLQKGQQKPINREQYEKSIKERMDLKKQTYLYNREMQDKRLKEIASKRQDLSKEPVHIAAKYLQELKKEDQTVDNLLYDVNYFKTRYKNRLSEYHNQKYQKKWNNFYFPSDGKRKITPIREKETKQLQSDEDMLDLDTSYKPSMKSIQKQNSITSNNLI